MKTKNRLFTFLKTVLIAFVFSFGVGAYAESTPEVEVASVQGSQAQVENVVDSAKKENDANID